MKFCWLAGRCRAGGRRLVLGAALGWRPDPAVLASTGGALPHTHPSGEGTGPVIVALGGHPQTTPTKRGRDPSQRSRFCGRRCVEAARRRTRRRRDSRRRGRERFAARIRARSSLAPPSTGRSSRSPPPRRPAPCRLAHASRPGPLALSFIVHGERPQVQAQVPEIATKLLVDELADSRELGLVSDLGCSATPPAGRRSDRSPAADV